MTWTYETSKEESSNYSKRVDFKRGNNSCYNYCLKHKLMDEFFPDSVNPNKSINNSPELESYSQYIIDNKEEHPTLFCKECGKLLLNEKMSRAYIRKIRIQGGDGCVLFPKTINGKDYTRKRCFDCFEKKYSRKHKSLNTIHYDFEYLFDVEESEIKEHLSLNAMTLKNCIKRHGKEKGTKIFNDYCDKQAYSNSFEYKQEKHGWTKEEYDRYNSSRSVTLENCIKRHGKEQGTKIFKDYCDKQSYIGCKEEYFIEKFGEEQGKLKYEEVNKQKVLSLPNFIRKYGKDVGNIKYKEYYNKRSNIHSIISLELFDSLDIDESWYGSKNDGEYFVIMENDRMYLLDYYVPSKNKAIEFHGDYWHGNPKTYKETDVIALGSITAGDKWKQDAERISMIESTGIEVLVIWESDYLKDKEGTLEKCRSFLGLSDSSIEDLFE